MSGLATTVTPGAQRRNQADAARLADAFQFRGRQKWDLWALSGLFALVCLWAWQFYSTWASWGNLTIDSGHEMYIPALLAEGKTLYTDVWFNFGPAAPYFNSYLFRLFGVRLEVLYWAGSLSALASSLLLYFSSLELSRPMIGWTAGAVLLMEAFQPTFFCFPLPYSFSAVYGCVSACLFLYILIRATRSGHWCWIFGLGTTSAVAFLLKPEFGLACYGTLAIFIGLRRFWTQGSLIRDICMIVPGVIVCAAVGWWMVSLRGFQFITQENIQSWPTSYFMQRYGKFWLKSNGFALDPASLLAALRRTLFPAGIAFAAYLVAQYKRSPAKSRRLGAVVLGGLFVYYVVLNLTPQSAIAAVVFPRDMVLYVIIAPLCLCVADRKEVLKSPARAAVPLVLIFTSALAFRIMLKMMPAQYPIYYNGPVLFAFLFIVFFIVRKITRRNASIFVAELMICAGCLFTAGSLAIRAEAPAKQFVPLVTGRGTVRVPAHIAEAYRSAISFMRQNASAGQYVLSIPEDTSLYFLSETYCPTRVFLTIPGSVAPGRMTEEFIQQIEQKHVRYLLWSNRMFWEYGTPIFGRDFNQDIGDYLRSHYHRVGPLQPFTESLADWNAQIWERND